MLFGFSTPPQAAKVRTAVGACLVPDLASLSVLTVLYYQRRLPLHLKFLNNPIYFVWQISHILLERAPTF